MLSFNKIFQIPQETNLLHIYQSIVLAAYAKCSYRSPLGIKSSAPDFSRDLILFFCRLLKNMPQNQSFVSNCFGALDSSRFTSLSSRHRPRRGSPSAGRLTRPAFACHLISFSCRLPKIHTLNHSVVCTRFGALKCAGGGVRAAPCPRPLVPRNWGDGGYHPRTSSRCPSGMGTTWGLTGISQTSNFAKYPVGMTQRQ
jgi:hypothetical protein